ncbi:MAG TPA: carboxypeptidase regulatory-like domain-containing protein [Candidatus Binatia bacterium]|nr:carboxypeptidase regulatory-like domain-containing protein [Candidatus Binatia bacterium]
MKRAASLVLFLGLFHTFSASQDRALISGDVEDRQDTPIAGAQIVLRNDALRFERHTTTNADGLYFFAEVIPAEGYVIDVAAAGISFEPQRVKFDLEVGETRHILPSFIGVKTPAPTAQLQRAQRWDIGEQAVGGPLWADGATELPVSYYGDWVNPAAALVSDANPQSGVSASTQQPSSTPPQLGQSAGRVSTSQNASATVESAKAPMDRLSSSISTVITSNQLRNLPLFNRNFLAVGLLVSSTHDVPAWSELKDTTFSISGQRPTQNAFLLDGMDNEATSSNQAIPFQVNDAIQEFRVTTANADAQFGRNIGGVVNVITRRGTTRFHGSIFGFFADSSMDASSPLSVYGGSGFNQAAAFAGPLNSPPAPNTNPNLSPIYQPNSYNQYVSTINFLNSTYSTTFCAAPNVSFGTPSCLQMFDPVGLLAEHDSHLQPFDSQQFGAQGGGSFGKRWYWFADYEGTRIDNPNTIFERVPSSYDRSHLSQFAGQPGYPDAALAQAVLSLYPQSNVPAIPSVLEFYQGRAPNYTNVDNYLGRIDFTQSGNSDWTFRYNLQNLSQLHDDTLPSSSTYPGNGAQRAVLNQNLVLTFTHRFSNQFSNVIRGGFTQFQVKETPQDAQFDGGPLGLPSGPMRTYLLSGLDPQYAGASPGVNGAWSGWNDAIWGPSSRPTITPSLDGLFPFARIGAPLGAPGLRRDREVELMDNLVWFKGKHTVRSGIDVRWLRNVFQNGGFSRGMVVSSDIGEFTSDSETCIACTPPAFSNPSFDYAIRQPAPFDMTFHSFVIAGYVQDTWRLRPNLTINAGLRYEYFSVPAEVNRQVWNYDAVANGLVQQGGSQVLDPYGEGCAQNSSTWYSVFGSFQEFLPWYCKNNGNGNFLIAQKTNFEPRIGIAWSSPSGNTVVRAGFGIFYDEVPVSLIAQLGFNRPVPYSTTNPQALYGQNFESDACGGIGTQCGLGNSSLILLNPQNSANYQAASIPFSLSAIDPKNFSNPLTRQVNVSIGRQVGRQSTVEVAYIGNFVANLPTTSNTGFNNEWFCTNTPQGLYDIPCDPFSFMPIFTLANRGYGNYNALVVRFQTNSWHGLQARVGYTFSKALDNGSEAGSPLIPAPLMNQAMALGLWGSGNPLQYAFGFNYLTFHPPNQFDPGAIAANFSALTGLLTQGVSTTGAGRIQVTPYTIPQDPYNYLRNDYGRSDYDQTNRFILEYTWDVPTRRRSIWLNGWMLSGVFIAESGQPFTIFAGPIAGELTERVSLSAPLTITGSPNEYIGNPSAIALPGPVCQAQPIAQSPFVTQSTAGIKAAVLGSPCLGDSARNQFTGPAYVDYDMAVQKLFKLSEKLALSLRAESYNLFNRPNYYNPISTFSLDGVTEYSQFGQIKSAHNPRQFQFGVRLNW